MDIVWPIVALEERTKWDTTKKKKGETKKTDEEKKHAEKKKEGRFRWQH